ncbi:MAG: cupredoxin domain-containing protein [Sphingomonadaceae bacterium]|nr:cupredoxin domain-containing protein [Sphingomonadaceae bacterium]
MRALILLPLILSASATATAQGGRAQTVEVQLSSFDFTPDTIQLHAGQPTVLHLVNNGNGGHNFSAPDFFAAATDVSGPVREGTIEVPGHQTVDVRLTPASGTYRLRCTHTLHTTFGMSGEIVVH